MHEANISTAIAKFTRRLRRFRQSDAPLLVKFCDRDRCADEHIRRFCRLPFERKVLVIHDKRPAVADDTTLCIHRFAQVPHGGHLEQRLPVEEVLRHF